MQVKLSHLFCTLGLKNYTKQEIVNSPRGNIVDCLGNLLATNKPVYTISWKGTGNKVLNQLQEDLILKLETLGIVIPDRKSLILAENKNKIFKIFRGISFENISKLSEQFSDNKNIYISKDWDRHYPYGQVASHIIGYLGNIQGKMGLEFLFNEELKGSHGAFINIINSVGKQISSKEVKKALIGQTIETTIDINIQKIGEKLFPQGYEGALIIFNPVNGALEAVVSKPSFDPEIFLKPLNYSSWQQLQEKNCFINRAFNACYPPASLFKLISLSAALETNTIAPNYSWDCKGYIKLGGRKYHCQRRRGHGVINIEQSIAYSCNIPFYEIGKKVPINSLAECARKFGLGMKADILFAEQAGLVPTPDWKLSEKKERWYLGETLSTVIGQSFLLVTPLQVARMFGGFCTGYLTIPRILLNEPIKKEKIDLKLQTFLTVRKSMRATTKFGNTKKLDALPNFKIWSKTGTAQTRKLSNSQDRKNCHAWFGAFFKYKNMEPRVIVALIENGVSSRLATEYAESFLKEYSKYIDSKENII